MHSWGWNLGSGIQRLVNMQLAKNMMALWESRGLLKWATIVLMFTGWRKSITIILKRLIFLKKCLAGIYRVMNTQGNVWRLRFAQYAHRKCWQLKIKTVTLEITRHPRLWPVFSFVECKKGTLFSSFRVIWL